MPALEARGVELSWSELGQGAPVLLIHETGVSSEAWRPLAEALASPAEGPGARVISYDRRGWGSSTAPDGYRRTTIEEQSEDAAALLESLGAGPAVLCGAGIGSVIALDLLLRHPVLAAGAALLEPPVLALVPEATEALSDDRVSLEQAVIDRGAEGAVDLYLAGGLALGPGVDRLPASLTAEARERPLSLFAELGAPTTWRMPMQRLADAEAPSVIVTAGSTPPLLRDAAGALAERLADSELRGLDSPKAPPQIGSPRQLAAVVLELSGEGPGGSS